MNTPLAERMRPKSLAEYFGQDHLVGPKGSLTQMIKNGVFPSLIFWGPPGTGKTTLAQLLALEKERPFYPAFCHQCRSQRNSRNHPKGRKFWRTL